MSDSPERPRGVYITKASGRKIICELAYVGKNVDGYDEWRCATPLSTGDILHIDVLPAKSSIIGPVQ
ncbi:hypothetical protein P5W11_09810 [Mycobacteroides abscessus subsp. bolletii]|uniref:hypothetical protein n=1 Tax=Mycobacteroides abscessus TaxID=36809 RepID=UPI00266CA08C|nr:hypothetical protein [Mycobacteroides abscessus]MDO3068507.1 hypothetical protein [Mycobacteroides abscessus subsp. bolletii]